LKLRGFFILLIFLIPLTAFAGRLQSVSGAEKAKDDYAILALHFDRVVPYSVQEDDTGRNLHLTIPDTYIEAPAERELSKLRNKLIRNVHITNVGGKLELEFEFSRPMQSLVWETRNPFSLVLDISKSQTVSQPTTIPDKELATAKQSEKSSVQKQSDSSRNSSLKTVKNDNSKANQNVAQHMADTASKSIHTGSIPPVSPSEQGQLSPQAHFLQALECKTDGNYGQALDHLQKASEEPSLYVKATTEMASIYRMLGWQEEEIAAWERLFTALQVQGLTKDETTNSRFRADYSNSDSELRASSSSSPDHSRLSTVLTVLLTILIIGLGALAFFLYKQMTLLNFKLALNESIKTERHSEAPPQKTPEPVKQKIPEPEDEVEIEPEPQPETEDESDLEFEEEIEEDLDLESIQSTEEKVPWGGDNLEEGVPEEERSSEDTATEVYALSEQGFTIQEIAEKLGLGQDEVRLILNLQREDSKMELEEVE